MHVALGKNHLSFYLNLIVILLISTVYTKKYESSRKHLI